MLLIFIGGGCYSTSGGIKFFRIGAIVSLSRYELDRLIYPNAVRPSQFGTTEFDFELMKSIWSLFAVLIFAIGIAGLILSMSGLEFQPAFTAAIAALSNAGPFYNSSWAVSADVAWPTYGEMSALQLTILSFVMLMGRLEVVAVIASIRLIFNFRQ